MTDTLFWVWLQTALGVGSIKTDCVVRAGLSPEQLYRMTGQQLEQTGFLSAGEAKAMKACTLETATTILRRAKELDCDVITPEHPHYPENLTHIARMPCVLYVRGDLSTLSNEHLLTMVGTRDSTREGEYAAFRLARDLAAAGCTVVSGLAVGIDCASHEGALSLGGRTIGILACGLDVDYPRPSAGLKKRILENSGVLMTEFPFGLTAMRHHFNIRNRLLSGISAGVVVVEAPARSGALNTANHALEQGKDVFAVPGGIFKNTSVGCNRLIREGGRIVINGYSILEEYIGRFPASIDPHQVQPRIEQAARLWEKQQQERRKREADAGITPFEPAKERKKKQTPIKRAAKPEAALPVEIPDMSDNAHKIYEVLCFEPSDCCTIAQNTGLRIMEIMSALTELELLGLAQPAPGQRFALKKT